MDSSSSILLQHMADGRCHSGESLGELLGVSRAAVWKRLQQLQSLGVDIQSVKGKGYCISGGLCLLNANEIFDKVPESARREISHFEILASLESTNQYLINLRNQSNFDSAPDRYVCLAEYQTSGRGRRGRKWHSPFAKNIYMSIAWKFDQGVQVLEGLSLAIGVAVVRALKSLGYEGLSLKWPNDILALNKKLGGILLEISGDASGECNAVIGVGLNVQMSAEQANVIDQPWIDLASLKLKSDEALIREGDEVEGPINRNAIVSAMLGQIMPLLVQFEKSGFAQFREEWESLSAYAGEQVTIFTAKSSESGIMLGITDSGGLKVQVGAQVKVFLGGEISLRASDEVIS